MTESGESLLVGAAYSLDVNNQTPGYGPGDVYWPWEATARSGRKGRKRVARIGDRKSTRLNSSHLVNSYAVFGLKKKNKLVSLSRSVSETYSD